MTHLRIEIDGKVRVDTDVDSVCIRRHHPQRFTVSPLETVRTPDLELSATFSCDDDA